MKPEQTEDWTGSELVRKVVEVAKASAENSAIPYGEVPGFIRQLSDSLGDLIRNTDTAIREVRSRAAQTPVSDEVIAGEAVSEPIVASTSKPAKKVSPAKAKKAVVQDTQVAEVPAEAASVDAPVAEVTSGRTKRKSTKASRSKAATASLETDDLQQTSEVVSVVSMDQVQETDEADTVEEPVADVPEPGPGEEGYKFADISREPIIPVSESVLDDAIICLIDGEHRKMLHRHLRSKYKMSEAEYKRHFDLDKDYPMTAPGYSKEKRIVAVRQGLGTPKLYENARSRQEQPTPAKVSKRKRVKADTAASA